MRMEASGLRSRHFLAATLRERQSNETLRNTKEAIESYLMALKEDLVTAPIEDRLFIGKVRVEATGL
jgi:hypothetical protein